MEELSRAWYTQEFKDEAVRLVTSGECVVTVAETLGVPAKTPANWVLNTKTGVAPLWRMIALGTRSILIKA